MKRIILILISTLAVSLSELHAESGSWNLGPQIGIIKPSSSSSNGQYSIGLGARAEYAFKDLLGIKWIAPVLGADVFYLHVADKKQGGSEEFETHTLRKDAFTVRAMLGCDFWKGKRDNREWYNSIIPVLLFTPSGTLEVDGGKEKGDIDMRGRLGGAARWQLIWKLEFETEFGYQFGEKEWYGKALLSWNLNQFLKSLMK